MQIVGNLLKPALLIPLLLMSRAAEVAGGAGPAFDEWRMSVIGPAGMATGVVGVGFGIGFALDMPVICDVGGRTPSGDAHGMDHAWFLRSS